MNKLENTALNTVRLAYFDIAKGVLIIYLILHHIIDFGIRNFGLASNTVLMFLREAQRPIILCYFMPAFFFITGYCSNFNVEFRPFIFKQIKTLLFPALFFTLLYYALKVDFNSFVGIIFNSGCKYWFITSLFVAKIIYWLLNRWVKKIGYIILLLLIVSFISTLVNEYELFSNIWWNRQTLDLILYLAVGNILKNKLESKKLIVICIFLYIICILTCYLLGFKIPHVTAGFGTTPYTWIIHVLLSISGSILLIKICNAVNTNNMLEYFGRNSFIIYMFQDIVLTILLKITFPYLSQNNFFISIFIVLGMWIIALIILSIISNIINTRYLKWTLGKW